MQRGTDVRLAGVPAGQTDQLAKAIAAYWSVPPWVPLLGGIEPVSAIVLQLSTSALVMLSLARGAIWPLLGAIGWHAPVDGTSVYAAGRFGILTGETIVAAFGAGSLIMILWARRTLPD